MKFRRPSHATVVAYLALFAAIGGSAYAASKVGTNDLKSEAVTSAKIRDATIRSVDLKNFVVRSERQDFPPNTVAFGAISECKKGERVVSGGGAWATASTGNTPLLSGSAPVGKTGWRVDGVSGASANTLIATAVCMKK